jgi:hypothetical protein
MKTMRFVFAVLLTAWATLGGAATLTLDPLDGANDSGDINALACTEDTSDAIQACPTSSLTGHDVWTLQILNPGFLNSIADVQLVPDDTGFFFSNFAYQIQEPSPLMIASATGPGVQSAPPNAPVTVGIYNVIVDWTLLAPAALPSNIAQQSGLQSAGYTIHIFTSAEPAAVPEPGTLLLMGAGILAIVVLLRRKPR